MVMKKHVISLVVAASFAVAAAPTMAAESFTQAQQDQIGKIAADYLLDHPEILVQVSQKLQQQQQQQKQQQLVSGAVQLKQALLDLDGVPHIGPDNAKVVVTEFFDYQCYYCSQMAPEVEKLVNANPNVKFVFRDWPIFSNRWENSSNAAYAGLKVWHEQGAKAYMNYHNGIFATGHNEGKLTESDINAVAKAALKKPLAGYGDKGYRSAVAKNYKLAQQIGFQGTPAFVVMPANGATTANTSVVAGAVPAANLQQAINHAAQ